jgi:streptogramin lyase
MPFPFSKHNAGIMACAVFFCCGFLQQIHGTDVIVSGGGGIHRLDGMSGELRQVISSETGFTAARIGPGGDLFALNSASGTIDRFDRYTFSFTGHYLSSSQLEGAGGIAFEADGRLVTGCGSNLHRFDGTAATPFQTIDLGPAGITSIVALAIGPDGRVYVSCGQTGRVASVDPASGASLNLAERFGAPRGIAFDSEQALLTVDSGLTPAVVRLAGDDRSLGGFFPGDLPGGRELQQPVDLTINDDGTIAVVDAQTNHILFFDQNLGFLRAMDGPNVTGLQPRSIVFADSYRRFPTYTDWRAAGFSAEELADESISGKFGDPTGDGKANLLRYALGVAPRESPDAHLPVQWIETAGAEKYLWLSYVRVSVPPAPVVAPLRVFTPVKMSVPPPRLVRACDPEIAPALPMARILSLSVIVPA